MRPLFYILSGSVIRFGIAFCCVCLKQDIIDTYIVKISQKNQNFSGKLLCSCFEVAVLALSNADAIRNILLSIVVVFAQSLNTIHYKQSYPMPFDIEHIIDSICLLTFR